MGEVMITSRKSYLLHSTTAVICLLLAGCAPEARTIESIYVAAPDNLIRGQKVRATVTLRYESQEGPMAGARVQLKVQPARDTNIDPAVSNVVLDDEGSAEVVVYIETKKSAKAGVRNFTMTATPQGGSAGKLEFSVDLK